MEREERKTPIRVRQVLELIEGATFVTALTTSRIARSRDKCLIWLLASRSKRKQSRSQNHTKSLELLLAMTKTNLESLLRFTERFGHPAGARAMQPRLLLTPPTLRTNRLVSTLNLKGQKTTMTRVHTCQKLNLRFPLSRSFLKFETTSRS